MLNSVYASFVNNLRNELQYLELDMSDAAIAQLGPKTQETASHAMELKRSVDDLTDKIEGYISGMQ